MFDIIKNIGSKIGTAANASWQFLSGKKRLIAIGCGLLAQVIPRNTIVGAGASWISNNLDVISTGLQVAAGMFGTTALIEHGVNAIQTMPSGISTNKEIK